ncbi:hypothetical protein [Microbacterium sp. G2-8]|uniref:hypothetical protein n=1 Tax=Microbacterium sp. G2-8 TaxID=2842454 RepID=UPI001C8AB0A1|nr:hypothetical protein [Microbacterium sp. G2-8]
MSEEVIAALVGAVIGGLLSFGATIGLQAWNERRARLGERAEWVEKIVDEKVIESLDGKLDRPPNVPRVPYAVDVVHRGSFRKVERRLRNVLAKIYSMRARYELEQKPMPEEYFGLADAVYDELDSWARGRKWSKRVFRKIDVELTRMSHAEGEASPASQEKKTRR